jgi:hypothetical protein
MGVRMRHTRGKSAPEGSPGAILFTLLTGRLVHEEELLTALLLATATKRV